MATNRLSVEDIKACEIQAVKLRDEMGWEFVRYGKASDGNEVFIALVGLVPRCEEEPNIPRLGCWLLEHPYLGDWREAGYVEAVQMWAYKMVQEDILSRAQIAEFLLDALLDGSKAPAVTFGW